MYSSAVIAGHGGSTSHPGKTRCEVGLLPGQGTIDTLFHTWGHLSVAFTYLVLRGGEKPEKLVETHNKTGRTCKTLH